MLFKKIAFIFIIVILVLLTTQPSRGYFSVEDKIKILLYHYKDRIDQNQKLTEVKFLTTGIPILIYHGIVKKPDGLNVTWDNFKEQMEALKDAGHETIDTQQLLKFLNGEDVSLPEKPIMITFDDGRRDSYYYSDFIFKELGFRAVMFVAVNKQIKQDPFFLNWEELNKMQESGRWDIQSHGKLAHEFITISPSGKQGHFASNFKWLSEQETWESLEELKTRIAEDYKESKGILEKNINGLNIIAYVFPFGDFGQVKGETNFLGLAEINQNIIINYYQLAFGQSVSASDKGFYINDHQNFYNIKRLNIDSAWSGEELVEILKESRLVQF